MSQISINTGVYRTPEITVNRPPGMTIAGVIANLTTGTDVQPDAQPKPDASMQVVRFAGSLKDIVVVLWRYHTPDVSGEDFDDFMTDIGALELVPQFI